ncbi:phosphotransferase [Hyalangium rubrum]|uniref:Maltokinase n=1 Tax=Hyalangium rubrum TaxID=3103134 RepID=A0ABU5HE18_9BACT|nr:phosphotransferase [Hyalangium sp. s54d21]MDY7231511.1 phosphotransferase [Hyalangium sp. s54d21]
MTPVDLTKLPDYLKQQRWFSGKAWPIKSVSVVDHATLDFGPCAFSLAIVEVQYELGHPERYLLPVKPSADGIQDALDDVECLRALFQLIREKREVSSASGKVHGEWLSTSDGMVSLPEQPAVRRLMVEQSNTSVVIGEKAILKIIRKLESGVNPEHEMGRFLATRTSFRATPTLLGALHLEGAAGATLAVVHRFVPNAVDGWKYTLEQFRKSGVESTFLDEMKELGRRLGELHRALSSDSTEPAFTPEPVLQEDLQRWSASIMGELGVTLAEAGKHHPDLERQRERLMEHARRLAHVTPSGQKTRIHGDLHLGQVLRAEGQWLIFDFEGEPSRTFTQRREKYSPLRDVAGMVRSFDYAEATVLLEGGAPGPRMVPSRDAFLAGYREATRGAPFLPTDDATFWTMLRAFELEKLLYEVRYEMQNRPDWVRIPVQALLRMEEPK